jgi:predicted nucleic acid-binding protein
MDFILDGEQIDLEDFSGASIYLDACFILTYLDLTDERRPEVARVIDVWSNFESVTLGISNHTIAEVINRIFQMNILGSIQAYHENNVLINQKKNGYDRLDDVDKQKLLNLDSARYIYGLSKREQILKFYRKDVNVNVSDLIKRAKEDEVKRRKLDIFYNAAVDTFEAFIYLMREELGFEVEFLDSVEDPHYQVAKANMRIMQLDITDSFHLAIAQSNSYDFLVTLDGDFIHNFYSKDNSLSTRIIKVA